MKIVIFSWRGPGHPNAGGAEIVTHEHAKAWVRVGHKVTLFTSYFPGAKAEEIIDGVKILRRGNDFVGVRVSALRWFLGLKDKPDLVFDHFHGIPFFTPLFIRQKKVAFIHEVAKEVWWMNSLAFPFNLLYALIGYFSEPFIFRLFYRNIPFVTVSESTKNDLTKWGIPTKHITIIHNGASFIKVREVKEQKKTAIFLGALSRDKGIEDALKAFALINRSQKDWQYWVVGKGEVDYLKKLKHLAKSLSLGKKVKFWGYVSEKKKFELLARAHIMVNSSVREGWGLVNIEANAKGTPVVGYNVPGIKDSVKDKETGLLVRKEKGAPGLARAAKKLMARKNVYKRFSRNAILWSENFSWQKATKESFALTAKIAKLNTLLLSWRGPGDPNAGGAEYVAHEHAKAWTKAGHNVTLFTSYFKGAKKEESIDGVRIIRKGYILLGVHLAAFFWYLFGKHKSFDLVVDHFHGIPFFTPLYVRTKKLAVIHEVAREVWMLNQVRFPLNLIIGGFGYLTEPLIFKLFYKNILFLTGSDSTKNDLVLLGIPSKNITVIHHGISIKDNRFVENKEKVVVFLGSLAKDKGIEDAIRVFDIINKKDPSWKFWIIGKGDNVYVNSLRKIIVDFSLNEKVFFWGFVDEDKKYELLARSYILLNPSVREGWGLINIEANAMGTPVVGCNVPGTKDSVVNGRTGFLSELGDYGSLANNILKLAGNPDLYENFQNNCYEWSHRFNWEESTKQSLELVERICKK